MKKKILLMTALSTTLVFASCGGGEETPESVAKQWCDLNAKIHSASSDADKEAAKEAQNKFENDMEAKYKGNDEFMEKVEQEVEKCEDASEGR